MVYLLSSALADAVNRALEANFLLHSFPFSYHVEILKKRLPHIGLLTIVCSNADYSPLFRDSLLELAVAGAKTIFVTDNAAAALRTGLHLRQDELALTPEEAEAVAKPYLGGTETYLLWRSSGGAYLTFMSSVCRLRNVPLPLVPSPQGQLTTLTKEALVAPTELIELLRKLGRYIEAFELAVANAPEWIAEFISEAGQSFVDQGLQKRLYLLLESLDEKYLDDERVLEWRFLAAFDQGEYHRLLPNIEAYLKTHEAPELRARYAGIVRDFDQAFLHANRAVAAKKTPLTLSQLARVHPDSEAACKILRESLKLAESQGKPYDITRSAMFLAEILAYRGQFGEADSWGKWALQTFDGAELKDGSRRLGLLKQYADTQTLMGRTDGWLDTLTEAELASRVLKHDGGTSVCAALVNLKIVLGQFEEAEYLATENLATGIRQRVAELTVQLVRILLEQGRVAEALSSAQHAFALTSEENEFYWLPASLALGMAYTFSEPEMARSHLTKVLTASDIEATYRITAALYLLKIEAITFGELDGEVQKILQALTPSAFRLLCGPEDAFSGVRNMLYLPSAVPLQIKVLGQRAVELNGQPLRLTDQALDVLVILALHPEGLSAEALHDQLYSEGKKLLALRAAVSRLRSVMPISVYPELYRITVPFEFDVHECGKAIASADILTALNLYRGALLEKSNAPGIVEARGWLEERVKQSALHVGSAEALMPLAEKLRDDLELWQAVHTVLPAGDARLPFVRAHLQRIRQESHPTFN